MGVFGPFLLTMRIVLTPFNKIMHAVDNMVSSLAGGHKSAEPAQIEQEIRDVVEEGQKEGLVDQQEREMIESVIEFRDTQVGQIMTARPEIVALELRATLPEVKRTLEESGHSRIPVYDGTLDHIVGILYARDLLKHLGQPPEQFNIRSAIRPAVFVSVMMGRIPPEGTSFEHEGVRYRVTSAEPQKVNRVKIELPVKEAKPAKA